MPEKNVSIIVLSPRARTGKTLLARLVTDYFLLNGRNPSVFDTDEVEGRFSAYFPSRSTLIDLNKVPDQMNMFDRLAGPDSEPQVVDLTHRGFQRFFKLLRDMDFVTEARSRDTEPVMFFIPDRDPESFELGRIVRDYFTDSAFVIVENAHIGEISKEARRSAAFMTLAAHPYRMALPLLDPFFSGAMQDTNLSLSEFMQRMQGGPQALVPSAQMSMAYLSLEARAGITAWLKKVFQEIGRVLEEVGNRPQTDTSSIFGDERA